MVAKLLSFLVYKIYLFSRNYLVNYSYLIKKEDFDYVFWGDSM